MLLSFIVFLWQTCLANEYASGLNAILREELTGNINKVPGGPGIPSAPGKPGRPSGPFGRIDS